MCEIAAMHAGVAFEGQRLTQLEPSLRIRYVLSSRSLHAILVILIR